MVEIKNPVLKEIWEDRYKKGDETIQDNIQRVLDFVIRDKSEHHKFSDVMHNGYFLPAGRTMSNSGIGKNLTLNNCFVAPRVGDSLVEIFDMVKLGAVTHQKGGGIGYDFSLIRPSGTPTSNEAIASGVVSFMDVFNAQTSTIMQGSRRGANMGVLNIYHMDIDSYIDAKSFESKKLEHFNMSVMVDDDFMRAVKNDDDIFLRFPVYDEQYKIIKDPSKWTHSKKIRARDLWDKVMTTAYNTGEIGVLFYDNMNNDNNTWYTETITHTNPCFTGDMRLLTASGYQTFESLENKEVDVVSYDGTISNGKVWCSGTKDTVEVFFANGIAIKCTPDHIFMLEDGTECQAKDLKGKRVKLYNTTVSIGATAIVKSSTEKVYDFSEPNNHWGVVEGVVVHNCGEYLAGTVFEQELPSSQYGGSCNLGSVFLHYLVENPFTENAYLNEEKLKQAVFAGVEFLDSVIDINNFPSEIYENYQKGFRTIGLGVTGLADTMAMLGLVYGSEESKLFTNNLMNTIAKLAYTKSIDLACDKGSFPFLDREKFVQSGFITKHIGFDPEWKTIADEILKYGIRNARILSVAPTGTLSLTYGNNCSSGIEPIFSLEYDRKVKIGGQDDKDVQIIKMQDYAYGLWKETKNNFVPENTFVTAMNLDVDAHIDILSIIAFHTDMSVSKTINIPTDYSFDKTKEVYMKCWELGIKGCTIFRPNEIRQGILISEEPKKPLDKPVTEQELKRGDIVCVNDDLLSCKRTIVNGCGKFYIHCDFDEYTGEMLETFIEIGSGGGYLHSLNV